MQLLIITYHIDMYIIIIIMPNNEIIDLIVSLLTAAYSINCKLFLRMYCVLYEFTGNSTLVKIMYDLLNRLAVVLIIVIRPSTLVEWFWMKLRYREFITL